MIHTVQPLLADVICKVNRMQLLAPAEETLYVSYLDRIADVETRRIIRKKFDDSKPKKKSV